MYIVPGLGQTTPRGQNFDVNRKASSLYPFVASFKEISLKSDFRQFFHDFLHVYSSKAGADNPLGQNFYVNRNILSLWSFVASFKKISLKSDFIQFFHDFIHVYSPRAGADSPQGTKFWCQQKGLITLPICYKFQRNLFEIWFYTIFSWFNTCIYPWHRGHTAPRGQSFDVNRNFFSLRLSLASFKS